MSDITTGTIYKIICKLDHKFVYIGSSFDTVRNRWQRHKKAYRTWIKDPDSHRPLSCYPYFKQFGLENFKILEIRKYDIHLKDRRCLEAYETLWISKTKGCCNVQLPVQYHKKEKRRQYQQDNRESLAEKKKQYQQDHKEHRAEYHKQHRQNNRESYAVRDKKRYETIKDELAVKVQCDCGSIVAKSGIDRHCRTAKHITFLSCGVIAEKVYKPVKVTCNCGLVVTKDHLVRHYQSAKHKAYLATQTE